MVLGLPTAQVLVFATLVAALILFLWGKIRHDGVALLCLLFLTIVGIVPAEKAFLGFGHPAVITVAAVLVIGKAAEHSGMVEWLGKQVLKLGGGQLILMITLCLLVAIASAFINNVGALALIMPMAIHAARERGYNPSKFLMPIAFASLLGGMMTLIGTPPNIIIAAYREEAGLAKFGMFDFAPVGGLLALIGVAFISILGWRMLPKRKTVDNSKALFAIEDYISEIRIEEDAPIIGKTIRELLEDVEGKIQILGINRNGHQLHAPGATFKFKAGDTLMIEVDGDDLKELLEIKGVVLGGEASSADKSDDMSTQISIKEVVLADYSPLINHTAASLKMRSRYGVNLLAIARRDRIMRKQMDNIKFKSGDVLLIQGPTDLMGETIRQFGGLPLAQRDLGLNYKTSIPLALSIFTLGVSLVVFDVLSVQVAFSLTAMAMVISGILPIKQVYTSIDWPVIVLLAAMIPVGESLEQTGGAALLADSLMEWQALFPSWFMLGILLTVTMLLSGVINNAATVVLMAPVALSLAQGLGHSIDPYLMAVAVGSSGAFLTPIGHQSNTLVMGPGGYRFTDYLILGLPISVIMVLVGVPLIMIFWPL